MPLPFVLGALGAAQGLYKAFAAKRQEKKLNKMLDATGTYQVDPNVQGNLAMAQNSYNGRMAGASEAEQNILSNEANTIGNVNRNATDASQALAIASGVNGQTNDALGKLSAQEGAAQQTRMGQLQQAVNMLNQEKGQAWADKLRLMDAKMGTKATRFANENSAVGDVVNGAGVGLSEGLPNFGGFFGRGQASQAGLMAGTAVGNAARGFF